MAELSGKKRRLMVAGSATVLAFLFPSLALAFTHSGRAVDTPAATHSILEATVAPEAQPITSSNSDSTSLKINGEEVEVPDNGSVNKTIESDGGTKTHVSVQKQTSTESENNMNSNHTSLDVDVESTSEN